MIGLLGSSGDTLSQLLLIVFLSYCLGTWVWEDYNSTYLYLVLLLFGGYFAFWFLLPLQFLGECGCCELACGKFFWDPDSSGHLGFQVKCNSRYWEMIFGMRMGS